MHYGYGLDKNLDILLNCLRPEEVVAAAKCYDRKPNKFTTNRGDEWEQTAQLFRTGVTAQDNQNDFDEWGWSIDVAPSICSNPCGSPLDADVLNDLSDYTASDYLDKYVTNFDDTKGLVDVDTYHKPYDNLLHCETDVQGDTQNDKEIELDGNSTLVVRNNNQILTCRKSPPNCLEISLHSMRPTAISSASAKCRPLLPVSRVQLLIKGAMRPPPSNNIIR